VVINLQRLAKALSPYYLSWYCIIDTIVITIRRFSASWKRIFLPFSWVYNVKGFYGCFSTPPVSLFIF
jgi:hypothetical protein